MCIRDRIQFVVVPEPWRGEVAAADNAHQRIEIIEERLLVAAPAVDEIALGVKKVSPPTCRRIMAQIELHFNIIAA